MKNSLALAALLVLALTTSMWGGTESVIYNFTGGNDGGFPSGALIFDSSLTNLYGTTTAGGAFGAGTIFELTPSGGGWTETVIYSFTGGKDGGYPVADLVIDSVGNLYGTAAYGGGGGCRNGCGVVFKLTKSGSQWEEHVLHTFQSNDSDGYTPSGPVVLGPHGHIYGTTINGGAYGLGIVFELAPGKTGWKERQLHSFTGFEDGGEPQGTLALGADGKLYGVTASGLVNQGTVFELVHQGKRWSTKILHQFLQIPDGLNPMSGVVLGADGALFGSTFSGGEANSGGTVFRLAPNGRGGWIEKVLYSFCSKSSCADGAGPRGTLTLDSAGNIYGSTQSGGLGYGTVFKLTSGSWEENALYSFTGGNDGNVPLSGIILDGSGTLYGTTFRGGSSGNGVVFTLVP